MNSEAPALDYRDPRDGSQLNKNKLLNSNKKLIIEHSINQDQGQTNTCCLLLMETPFSAQNR